MNHVSGRLCPSQNGVNLLWRLVGISTLHHLVIQQPRIPWQVPPAWQPEQDLRSPVQQQNLCNRSISARIIWCGNDFGASTGWSQSLVHHCNLPTPILQNVCHLILILEQGVCLRGLKGSSGTGLLLCFVEPVPSYMMA